MRTSLAFLVAALALVGGCNKEQTPTPTETVNAAAAQISQPQIDTTKAPPISAPHVDTARAMRYVREFVNIGSRTLGASGHKKAEDYIRGHLKQSGAQIEEDNFTAETPAGKFAMRNFVAKFAGTNDRVVVIASHYETPYPLGKNFVGANDGGSSTGLLLELASQLRAAKPRNGYSVWLVFFDGEEAVKQWSDSDSLYGSRHLAAKWQQDSTLKKIKAFILLDMIGDADLNIDRDHNSAAWLEDLAGQSAAELGYQSYFFRRDTAIEDDHIPFVKAGVPCADLIDLEYGYRNVFWHTPQDTVDKLSPKSLEIVGDVVMATLARLDQR